MMHSSNIRTWAQHPCPSCERRPPNRLRVLATLLTGPPPSILQGAVGCKPLVALMRYMQDSSTSLSVLQDMLQPLLDAEQHLPPQMPVPSPQMTPAERSAFLRSQLKQAHPASSSSEQQQQQSSQPRIAHLLKTLGLAVRTLHIMDQEQGFKQVASGPLSLWYRHDTVAKSQILRARVVLDESVAVRPAAAEMTVAAALPGRACLAVVNHRACRADSRLLQGWSGACHIHPRGSLGSVCGGCARALDD